MKNISKLLVLALSLLGTGNSLTLWVSFGMEDGLQVQTNHEIYQFVTDRFGYHPEDIAALHVRLDDNFYEVEDNLNQPELGVAEALADEEGAIIVQI